MLHITKFIIYFTGEEFININPNNSTIMKKTFLILLLGVIPNVLSAQSLDTEQSKFYIVGDFNEWKLPNEENDNDALQMVQTGNVEYETSFHINKNGESFLIYDLTNKECLIPDFDYTRYECIPKINYIKEDTKYAAGPLMVEKDLNIQSGFEPIYDSEEGELTISLDLNSYTYEIKGLFINNPYKQIAKSEFEGSLYPPVMYGTFIIGDFNNWELPDEVSLNGSIPMRRNYHSEDYMGSGMAWHNLSANEIDGKFAFYEFPDIFYGLRKNISVQYFDSPYIENLILNSSCSLGFAKNLSEINPFEIKSKVSDECSIVLLDMVKASFENILLEESKDKSPAEIKNIDNSESDGASEYYSLTGFKLEKPVKGILIKKQNGKFNKVIIK